MRHARTHSVLAVIISLLAPASPSSATGAGTPSTDMIRALEAPGPAASLGAEARVFDRFVGTWDLEGEFTAADGTKTPLHGFWLFGWVLQGQIMQDLIIEGDLVTGRQRGTSLRFFETQSKQWRVEWIPPRSGAVVILHGGAEGDRIVLLGTDFNGAKVRWSFNDIKPDAFFWRGETSSDGGATWRTEQVMNLKRHSDPTRAAAPAQPPAKAASAAEALFARLTSLVGEWQGVLPATDATATYTLTADGSALMEEFRPAKGQPMMTMFTVDGDRILATHYCSAGNQPMMATSGALDPQTNDLPFALERVTGLHTPGDWHNTALVVHLGDRDRLSQQWTYEENGKTGTRVFEFTRRK